VFKFLFSLMILSYSVNASCKNHYAMAEKKHGIPSGLLEAMGRVESTHNPWAINVNTKGRGYSNKEAALKRIKQARLKGATNINIGCLQLHWYHHLKKFKSINDMIDPKQNVMYAAKYLKILIGRYKSLSMAVRRYNSPSKKHNMRYLKKVAKAWKKIQKDREEKSVIRNISFTKMKQLKKKKAA
jgi:soluble lytic murein transglycosylase-like protein